MCLSTVYPKKKRSELIKKYRRGEFVWVWKTFKKAKPANYQAVVYNYRFRGGKNRTKWCYDRAGYKIAFHSCLSGVDAVEWAGQTVRCRVPVKSITAVGMSYGDRTETIVSTEIICPKYFGSRK